MRVDELKVRSEIGDFPDGRWTTQPTYERALRGGFHRLEFASCTAAFSPRADDETQRRLEALDPEAVHNDRIVASGTSEQQI